MAEEQETTTAPWDGMTAEEAFALGQKLRDAETVPEEETEGGYEPMTFRVRSHEKTFPEQSAIDVSVTAISTRAGLDFFTPIVDWETAQRVAQDLAVNGDNGGDAETYVHWVNDDQISVHTVLSDNGSSMWGFWEKPFDEDRSIVLEGVFFEVVTE